MPRSPACVPDLCISSRSSLPKEGVSFLLSSSRAFCKTIRVASEIRPLVLIQISVVDVIDYSSERLPVSVVEHNLVDGRETSFLIAVLPHLVCRSVN